MMRKILPFLCCLILVEAKATSWEVDVADFQFTPSTLNVVVGDVLHFVWINGGHTTTSSSVPVGAAPWDSPINSLNTTFDYTVTTAGAYTFFCQIHGALLMSGSVTATGVAPVTLSAFNISTQNNKPLLSWTTQTELNADHFSIRKSTNGIDFKEIGTVKATGNSVSKRNYSFADEAISSSVKYVYYALATIDKDGKLQLSPIIMYRNKSAAPRLIISLSPNPVGDMGHLMLQFNADRTGVMTATLSDMQGKVVLKTGLSAVAGINNAHIHLRGVASGIYTISFKLDGITESYRVVKN
jgi:plastocyanin